MPVSIVLRGGSGDGRRLDLLALDEPPTTVDWLSGAGTVVYEYSGARAGLDFIYTPTRVIERIAPKKPAKAAKKAPRKAAKPAFTTEA